MKYLSIAILILSVHANAEICHLVELPQSIKDLSNSNCDIINKSRSCAKEQPTEDPRKRITDLINTAESKKETLIAENKLGKHIKMLFKEDTDNKFNPKPPMYILDWFKELDNSIDHDQLKNQLIEKYVKYASDFDCTPNIIPGLSIRELTSDKIIKTETKAKQIVAKMDVAAEIPNMRGNKAIESLNVCSTVPQIHHKKAESYSVQECSADITHLFKDNVWKFSDAEASDYIGSNPDLTNCIQSRLKQGQKINHISISSSASTLNNTFGAAEEFCAKGFLELSQARAETAKNKILPLLVGAGSNYPVKINSAGKNGDGTSGDCAYKLVNGKEVMKSYYQKGEERRKELDANKFVKVVVTFDSKPTDTKPIPPTYYAKVLCRKIRFECPRS